MWRAFMSAPQTFSNNPSTDNVRLGRKKRNISPAVVDRIFDELDILDRCCFALCNKALLKHALNNEHLDYLLDRPPTQRQLEDFFERRLGRGWVDSSCRYCPCCGIFASTVAAHWRLTSERLTRERSGTIADLWRFRRNDGWLRYWIERWCQDPLDAGDSASSAIMREDRTRLVCPKCAIIDITSNNWRKKVSGSGPGD